jgi:hypothetical protein
MLNIFVYSLTVSGIFKIFPNRMTFAKASPRHKHRIAISPAIVFGNVDQHKSKAFNQHPTLAT